MNASIDQLILSMQGDEFEKHAGFKSALFFLFFYGSVKRYLHKLAESYRHTHIHK